MPARVKTIKKSRAAYQCEKCGSAIPLGSPYRYFKLGFRSNVKHYRCMKPACAPRQSELVTNKLSEAYAAQEDAEFTVNGSTTVDDIEEALRECAERADGVREEYEAALEAAPMLEEQVTPNIEALQEWSDALTAWDSGEDVEGDAELEGEMLETVRESAIEVLNSLSV